MSDTIEEQKSVLAYLLNFPEMADNVGLDANEFNSNDAFAPTQKIYNAFKICVDDKTLPDAQHISRYAGVSIPYAQGFFDMKYEPKNIESYVKIIRNDVIRKELRTLGDEIVALADTIENPTSAPLEIEERLKRINFEGDVDMVNSSFGNLLAKSVAQTEYEKNIPLEQRVVVTPFTEFNRNFDGLFKGDMNILAAGTGAGKTSFASDLITNALNNRMKVASIVLEMSEDQLVQRQIVRFSDNLSMNDIRTGRVLKDNMMRQDYYNAVRQLNQYGDQWNIYGTENNKLERVLSIGRKQALTGVDFLTVDYLQLINNSKYPNDRHLAIGMASQALAQLAKATNISVLTLVQLNRSIAARQDKRPMLSDLKGSSGIEQSGDGVFFLYRDSIYNPDSDMGNKTELIVAKMRNGKTGTIMVEWNGRKMSFEDIVETW